MKMNSISAVASLGVPLIPKIDVDVPSTISVGSTQQSTQPDAAASDKKVKSMIRSSSVVTSAVCLLAAGAGEFYVRCFMQSLNSARLRLSSTVAASAVAMASIQSIIVFVTGGISCLNAPTIIHRHYQISKSPSEFLLAYLLLICFFYTKVYVRVIGPRTLTLSFIPLDLRSCIGVLQDQLLILADSTNFLSK